MTKLERAVIKEMVYWIEEIDRSFVMGAGSGLQEVQGQMRKCCVMCGHCPSALADKLKELLHIEDLKLLAKNAPNTNIKVNKDGTISPIDPKKPSRFTTK